MFVCLFSDHNSELFASNFSWGTLPNENVLGLVLKFLFEKVDFYNVNFVSRQSLVPQLVYVIQLFAHIHIYIDMLATEIRKLQRSINNYNMRYFPQHVLLCTSTVHDQSGDICIQGYLRILWIGNSKSFKIDNIHKRYVLCLKLEYFFKSCKF